MIEREPLTVFEYSGTARSGKGTIVQHIADTYVGVETEETGADYRALTWALLSEGTIEPGMTSDVILRQLSATTEPGLAELIASSKKAADKDETDPLHSQPVNELVSNVSPLQVVRAAVKSGFKQRVMDIRDGDTQILLVDGRNLAQVIGGIRGTRLLMRTFVSCVHIEGAWRERDRLAGPLSGESMFSFVDPVRVRNENDSTRAIDPVTPERDAIDYWYDREIFDATVKKFMADNDIASEPAAFPLMFKRDGAEFTDYPRYGAGTLAVQSGRQIHFDTSYFRTYEEPKSSMLNAATVMFDEALEAIK